MKERLEIERGQERQDVVRSQPLPAPEENGREECPEQKSQGKVGEESGGVFQAC